MSSDKLTRVNWQMGQALLPHHLIAQEESLLAHLNLRFSVMGMPLYGIAKLFWNDSLLKEGVLSIIEMNLILSNGRIIDIPNNAKIEPFNLGAAGTTKVSVYLHIIQGTKNSEEISYAQNKDETVVDKIMHIVELSSEQSHANTIHTMKLANFTKDGEGVWSLMEDYVPPLLQVGSSPFFMSQISYLEQMLEIFHFKLEQEIMTSYLSGENLFSAKQCLQGVYKLKIFFRNLKGQMHYHPYFLYEALKHFYIELCFFQNYTPENVDSPYEHDQLTKTMTAITEPLLRQIQMMKAKTPYVEFKRKEGYYVISKLPKEVVDAKEIYFLLQKPSVTTAISVDALKLASMSRLPMVHQMALQGIPIKPIERPPFQHSFGAEVEFFTLVEGEEWDRALGDGSIAFYELEGFDKINAYLYWRQ